MMAEPHAFPEAAMAFTRREFGKVALAGLPATALLNTPLAALATQARPSSRFNGVQIGVITYSYRSMPDQSAQATLKYVLDSGISAIELMDGPVENFLGRPAPAARGGGPGGGGGARGRAGGEAPAGPTPYEQLMAGTMPTCTPPEPGRVGGGGGGRGGRGQATPEQLAAQQAAADELRKWRTSVSLDRVRDVRRLFNDAGVSIYAYKPDGMQKNMQTTDAEFDYVFAVAATLGASHLTMELPGGETALPLMKRMMQFAEKHKVPVAYHTHGQGSMTAFDEAMALSKWNMINVDLGHYVAAGNPGGSPIQFLERHHARISSFHLKDRTLPQHCSLTVPFGMGNGQVKEILQTIRKNKWTFPATIELEYPVPATSDAMQEVKKCVEFARLALA
jgi:sugar phosphate isomerase/epimerase